MNDEEILKQKLRDAEYTVMNMMDFIEFLFDTELDYTSHTEQWDKFEAFQDQNQAK